MTLKQAIEKIKTLTIVGAKPTDNSNPVRALLAAPIEDELFVKFKDVVMYLLQTSDFENLDAQSIGEGFGEVEFRIVALRELRANDVVFENVVTY